MASSVCRSFIHTLETLLFENAEEVNSAKYRTFKRKLVTNRLSVNRRKKKIK